MTKLAVTVDEASAMSGIGRTSLFALMKSGALPRRKRGARTLILVEDLEACLRALPAHSAKEAA